MSAAALLTDLASYYITLKAEGETLRYYAAEGTLTPKRREHIKRHKPELLAYLTRHAETTIANPAETRRRIVLDILAKNPSITHAFTSDDEIDSEYVIITLAIRGQATCDLRIPRARYDGLKVLALIEQYADN